MKKLFQIKTILMGTVDKKEFLVGKVKSAGIVNKDRATLAATYSVDMPVDKAIERAREEISKASAHPLPTSFYEKSLGPKKYQDFLVPLPSLLSY